MSKDCTIQDVFHRFYPSFESTHSISPAQRKAAYHIMNCKTGAFGVNNSYTLLFIMRLQILSVNLLLIVNILGLISAIFVSSIHGEAP